LVIEDSLERALLASADEIAHKLIANGSVAEQLCMGDAAGGRQNPSAQSRS
jgi:hypothetical protein